MTRLILFFSTLCIASISLAGNPFPRPAELQADVDFWVKIYTEVDTNSGLLHDPWNLGVVYQRVDLPAHASRERRQKVIDQARAPYQAALRELASGKRDNLSAEARQVLAAWPKGTPNQRFRQAADEVRFQLGQSDRFKAGLVRSGQWRDHIRRTLTQHGLPHELDVLPHVESSFNPGVYSRVAAAGMWQFMPATAKQYMAVDHLMDERLDPYVSTDAAARLLKNNLRVTGTWPLALTGYNHGANGVNRAAKAMGTTDITRIVREYRGPSFGFASRNFYVSFLAALEVDRNAARYFGSVAMAKPIDYDRVTLKEYIDAATLARAMGTSTEVLRSYNPALLSPVWSGEKRMPPGYTVKFPRAQLKHSLAQSTASIPAAQRYAYQQPDVIHRIASGETLSHVARRYKVSVSELMALNGLRNHNIRAGQTLRLPGRIEIDTAVASRAAASRSTPSGDNGIYVIQPGDSLWGIARRFNRTEKELLTWNSLNDKNRIRPGDTLRVAFNEY